MAAVQNGAVQQDPEPQRWQEVLEVAARRFFEQGYEATAVSQIAKDLGITKGSLYHYISSKDDLLFAIIDEMHRLTNELLERVISTEGEPLDQLWHYFVGSVKLNVDHLHASTLIYRDISRLTPGRRDKVVEARDRLQTYVRAQLKAAQDAGQLYNDLDVNLSSIQMFSVVNSIYQWYSPTGQLAPDVVARSIATFVIRGVARDSWTPPSV